MRRRGESHDEQPRIGVAKARDGLSPVLPVAKLTFLLPGYTAAIGAQARAAGATDDGAMDGGDRWKSSKGHSPNVIRGSSSEFTRALRLGESDREPLAQAAVDRERLHRDRGAEEPGAPARGRRRGRTQYAETGEGGVAVYPAHARPLAQQRIGLAEAHPSLAGELTSLCGIDQQGDDERTCQGGVRWRPRHARGQPCQVLGTP